MTRITQQNLESYLWGAAVLLRGTIDAGDYKQFIFPLLFFKRLCDVFDEETVTALRESDGDQDFALFPENHRFQVPADAHWREIRKVNRDVGRGLQQAMRAIETANPDKLFGIFGDAQWTNKDRLSDAMLRDLIEHFSTLELTVANLPEDELGQGYEYLIKKFADDSGHTAAEFYTNRTVVHLMTEMLDVQPGESVYDPTCGSGGMLLSCIAHLRNQKKEWRNVKLYGQERNLMTSSIARMNCFLHGIEDFRIERGDTLAEPKLVEGDRLQRFDVVLANPPYSIKQWNREAFAADPWGRNVFGVPPQGRADYAFQQHILQSLKPKTGRCAVLWPHGVLFRQEEDEMRKKMVEADLVEAVIGVGANLFYNASMEACVVICRTAKPKDRRGKILFINAVNEVTRERAQSFLKPEHIEKMVAAYRAFKTDDGFATVATLDEVRARGHSLKIDLYVQAATAPEMETKVNGHNLKGALESWDASRISVRSSLADLFGKTVAEAKPVKIASELLAGFDRSKWKRVRFGDVVKQMKEQVDPEADGVERYVAGEHMETENVHIRKWGTVGDGYLGPAFIRGFRKGQVLYGSRRTYLKKVAVAEWDGVTANTTFVIEAVEGKLLQELLPWLMLSERFTKHSVQESKGSTNPYINFPDIAKFEFDLPPLDQQRRIAEILWAMDESEQSRWRAKGDLEALKLAYEVAEFDKLFHQVSEGQIKAAKLRNVLTTPICNGIFKTSDLFGKGTLLVNVTDIYSGFRAVPTSLNRVEVTHSESQRFSANPGDVIFNRSSLVLAGIGHACLVPEWDEDMIFECHLMRARPDAQIIDSRFMCRYALSPRGRRFLMSRAQTTTMTTINQGDIGDMPFPLPDLERQRAIANHLDDLESTIAEVNQAIASDASLKSKFANQLFS